MADTFTPIVKLALLLLLVAVGFGYQQIDDQRQYDAFLERHSQFPVFHVYHNRHFSKSRQFQDFLEVVDDAELRTRDFAKFILTDCEKTKKDAFDTCQALKDNNENRAIQGLMPSDKLLTMGDKKLQRSPATKTFRHPSDVYTVQEITDFVEGLVPYFITHVATQQDLEEFLRPRYSPKLLYFTKEDSAPLNIGKLTVHFNLRVDFAFVEDLSVEIVEKYGIQKFPSLLLLTYNYSANVFDQRLYEGPQFDLGGYFRIKEWLAPFALVEQRVDLMFHNIKRTLKNDIVTVDNDQDLWRQLDSAPGWVIVQYSPQPERVLALEKKNGLFMSYIHYKIPEGQKRRLENYLPRVNQSVPLSDAVVDEIPLQTVDAESALSNISALVSEDYTVLLVREQYGYVCPITEQTFFRGLVFCLVLSETDYGKFKERVGQEVKVGLVCKQGSTPGQFTGQPLEDVSYEKLYTQLEYVMMAMTQSTKMKLNELMKDYFTNPIKEFREVRSVALLCRDPHKKCVIALLNPEKPEALKVELEYLKEVAYDYFTEFKFFWADAGCNAELKKALDEPKMTMIVFDPATQRYAPLRNRISKTIASKFLSKARRGDLQLKPFGDPVLNLNSCKERREQADL